MKRPSFFDMAQDSCRQQNVSSSNGEISLISGSQMPNAGLNESELNISQNQVNCTFNNQSINMSVLLPAQAFNGSQQRQHQPAGLDSNSYKVPSPHQYQHKAAVVAARATDSLNNSHDSLECQDPINNPFMRQQSMPTVIHQHIEIKVEQPAGLPRSCCYGESDICTLF